MKTLKKLLSKLRSYFKKKPKVWELEEGHVIVPAFMDRGVQYYEIKDVFNTFSNRGLMALQVYEEWDMRLKKEDLLDFILAFEKILNTPKELNVMNLVKVVSMLKERVNFPIATEDIYYKFASVRYFDEHESPYTYDPEYNKIKIARWKEASSEVDAFFISSRLVDMLPLPKLSKEDLPSYLAMVQKVSDYQLGIIRDLNSPQQTSGDSSKG
jgi:hypothetical protein